MKVKLSEGLKQNREKINKERIFSIKDIVEKKSRIKFKNINILEYGCHTGSAISKLCENNNRCTGADVDAGFIEFAKKNNPQKPGLEYIQIEGTLPFPDKSFDFIFSSEVVEHIPVNQRELYFKEFARVLKDDGVGYISYPNFWFPYENHYKMPFHHWVQKVLSLKNPVYEDIPAKNTVRNIVKKYFNYKDITPDFLDSDYVKQRFSPPTAFVAKLLSRSPFAIQDYLLLFPKTKENFHQ